MNGRIYDAKLARFLQADPIVQDPTYSQSLNRYSYTFNNPLNATDPDGFRSISKIIDAIVLIVAVVIEVYCQGCGAGASLVKNYFNYVSGYLHAAEAAYNAYAAGNIFQAIYHVVNAYVTKGQAYRPGGSNLVSQSGAGTASIMTDGKFGNGAFSGSFLLAANDGGLGDEEGGLSGNWLAAARVADSIKNREKSKNKVEFEYPSDVIHFPKDYDHPDVLTSMSPSQRMFYWRDSKGRVTAKSFDSQKREMWVNSVTTVLTVGLGARGQVGTRQAGATKGLAGVPGRVQSRINLQTGTNKFGMKHILREHLSGKTNKSQFNLTEGGLRSLLQSKQVVSSPIVKTLQSKIHGTLYVRQVDVGRNIGTNYLKNNSPTSILTTQSDKYGNIVTAFPGK